VLDKHVVPTELHAFVQHDADPAEPLHAPFVHVDVVTAVQPLAPTAQVCRLVLDRQVAPTVHAFVQQDAEPAVPLHAPFEQVSAENW
jgi:hypothetical protein